MIIVLKAGASEADIEDVSRRVRDLGFKTHLSRGEERTIIGVVGDDRAKEQLLALQALDSVENVVRILQPFKLASREAHPESTQFRIHGVPIGGKQIVVMAGPCSVESRPQLMAVAEGVKAGGAHVLRGGAFKPRTSPYSFQGLGEGGLRLLAEAREETGMPVVTEVMDVRDLDQIWTSLNGLFEALDGGCHGVGEERRIN